MKLKIELELDDILKKPVDEIDQEDDDVLEEAKASLPRKEVVLGKDETMMDPGVNAKPVEHIVAKGETLKKICEKYSVSYGEMCNHLMNTEGTTSIHTGMKLKIPRHFIDLTEAT
jgi:hypothetical protein